MGRVILPLAALLVAAVSVHLAYIGYIRPEAEALIQAALAAGQTAPRDMVVVLKDVEQEICLILTIWGVCLISLKCWEILRSRFLFSVDFMEGVDEKKTDPARILRELENLPQKTREAPLVRTLSASLRRFLITGDVQNTSDAVDSSVEALALRQEAETSMIRYLIWAIPSIGFIGTVRGIGLALSQADEALAGNISNMTDSLGVAFNSTLVALLCSILLMFLLHQLQRLQDGVVVDTQAYCEAFLLNRISKTEDL
ncbi:MAG: MotA/TolQ/ExbB proton channel family protein [Magnetovibrionaceae bacterium]